MKPKQHHSNYENITYASASIYLNKGVYSFSYLKKLIEAHKDYDKVLKSSIQEIREEQP